MGNYIVDLDFCFDQVTGPIIPLAAYAAATDTVIQTMGLNQKVIKVKNTGANDLVFTIVGSIDRGVEYEYEEKADTTLTPGTFYTHRFDVYYTHVKVRVKAAAATTATIKAAGQSV